MKDKMDLAVNIAIGSSAQVALFVAPVLVLLSFVVGPRPMALVFNGYEIGGADFAVLIATLVTAEGESNWFEGVQLWRCTPCWASSSTSPDATTLQAWLPWPGQSTSTPGMSTLRSDRRGGGSRGRAGARPARAAEAP